MPPVQLQIVGLVVDNYMAAKVAAVAAAAAAANESASTGGCWLPVSFEGCVLLTIWLVSHQRRSQQKQQQHRVLSPCRTAHSSISFNPD